MNQTQLEQLVKKNFNFYQDGHVADYIPALGEVNPKQLGVSLYDLANKQQLNAGDSNVRFAIESISKVPVLLLAIQDRGLKTVFNTVGNEPTGFAFNSIMNMEINNLKHPMNPFVNAGAIVTSSLVKGDSDDERFGRILSWMQEIMDDPEIYLAEETYKSEWETCDVNRSLSYYEKANGMFPFDKDVPEVLDVYCKQCSVMVTAEDLAHLGAVLANKGVAPWNGKRLISEEAATITKSIMTTAGLYNQSGDYSVHVGVPSKSGVGGGLMVASPEKFGIGTFSPALDKDGNSVAGIHLLEDLVSDLNLDIFK